MVPAGCSGSHSEPPGGSSGTSGTAELSLTVIDQATGQPTNTLSATKLTTARAVVRNTAGQAVPSAVVRFASSDAAAVLFSPAATALTDSQGLASVNVAPASNSNLLTITTAQPIRNRFSLSFSRLNIEAWQYDGEPTTPQIIAADIFGNPMPEGTAISADVLSGRDLRVSIAGDKVLNTTARGGTFHQVVIGGLNEDTGQCSGTGNVVINATTPRGNVNSLPVFVAP